MIAVAGRAFTTFILFGVFGNRHSELIFTLLAFICPFIPREDIAAGPQRRPGRSLDNVRVMTGRTMYFQPREIAGHRHVEDVPAFLT